MVVWLLAAGNELHEYLTNIGAFDDFNMYRIVVELNISWMHIINLRGVPRTISDIFLFTF